MSSDVEAKDDAFAPGRGHVTDVTHHVALIFEQRQHDL